jgi:hypothetical protein
MATSPFPSGIEPFSSALGEVHVSACAATSGGAGHDEPLELPLDEPLEPPLAEPLEPVPPELPELLVPLPPDELPPLLVEPLPPSVVPLLPELPPVEPLALLDPPELVLPELLPPGELLEPSAPHAAAAMATARTSETRLVAIMD